MKPILILLIIGTALVSHAQPSPPPPRYELTIEAFVDGPSSLRFTRSGFYWSNGRNAKPGRHDALNEPTYVNGKAWMPRWSKGHTDRGEDTTEPFP